MPNFFLFWIVIQVEQGCRWQLDEFIRCVRDNRIGWQGDCIIPQNQLQVHHRSNLSLLEHLCHDWPLSSRPTSAYPPSLTSPCTLLLPPSLNLHPKCLFFLCSPRQRRHIDRSSKQAKEACGRLLRIPFCPTLVAHPLPSRPSPAPRPLTRAPAPVLCTGGARQPYGPLPASAVQARGLDRLLRRRLRRHRWQQSHANAA